MTELKQFTIECHKYANHIKNQKDLESCLYDLFKTDDDSDVYMIKRHENGIIPDYIFPDVYGRFTKMIKSGIPFVTIKMKLEAYNADDAIDRFRTACENLNKHDFYISRYCGNQILDQAFISNTNPDINIETLGMTIH
jgi:hypothetical protein